MWHLGVGLSSRWYNGNSYSGFASREILAASEEARVGNC